MRLRVLMPAVLILASTGLFSYGSAFAQEPGTMPESMAPKAKTPVPTGPLKLSFNGKSAEYTVATLAALPHKTITVYNEHAKANQTFSGVPLMDLLRSLGVPDKPHGKEFRLYLVAKGADGYEVVYSLGEVTPDVHDGTTLVADAVDGKPLGDNGPVQLVTTGEKRPARWVRNLVEIRVASVD